LGFRCLAACLGGLFEHLYAFFFRGDLGPQPLDLEFLVPPQGGLLREAGGLQFLQAGAVGTPLDVQTDAGLVEAFFQGPGLRSPALVFGGEPLLVLLAQAGDLLRVPRPQRPIVRLALGLEGLDAPPCRLLGLREPRRLRTAQLPLSALGERLYLFAFLLARLLRLQPARVQLPAERLYLRLLGLDDGLVVPLELQFAPGRRTLERPECRLVPLFLGAALLGKQAFDFLIPGALELLSPPAGLPAGSLERGLVALFLLPVLRPELFRPAL
jgi:hypothetical protein